MASLKSELSEKKEQRTWYRRLAHRSRSSLGLKLHTKKILQGCLLVVVPMTSFSIVMLALVFANLASNTTCSNAVLCPGPPIINSTSSSYYYVDYRATRLVFVSSWSSAFSFTLISAIMAMSAYCSAAQLLGEFSRKEPDSQFLSPYQMNLFLRILNVDYLSLVAYIRDMDRFKQGFYTTKLLRQLGNPLQSSAAVLTLAIFSSMIIQAANVYLHVSTESVEIVQFFPESLGSRQYSKRLGSWCLDSGPTFGTMQNINFWGCSITYDETSMLNPTNASVLEKWKSLPSSSYLKNFTDSVGEQFVILGPLDPQLDVDYTASSFAVSSQCKPVPASSCDITTVARNSSSTYWSRFHCLSSHGSPIDLQGTIPTTPIGFNSIKFHKHLYESEPFGGDLWIREGPIPQEVLVPSVTDEQAIDMWSNPRQWISHASIYGEVKVFPDAPEVVMRTDSRLPKMVLYCNTFVFDVTYSMVGGVVANMSKQLSNSTVTGISTAVTLNGFKLYSSLVLAVPYLIYSATTMDTYLKLFNLEMSRILIIPLAVHTVSETSPTSQLRTKRIVAKVSMAALWLLVLANMLFAVLATAVAFMAWKASSEKVHQVQSRLGIAGLATSLFDQESSRGRVESSRELFHENHPDACPEIAVGVRKTQLGGAIFTLETMETQEMQDTSRPSEANHFHRPESAVGAVVPSLRSHSSLCSELQNENSDVTAQASLLGDSLPTKSSISPLDIEQATNDFGRLDFNISPIYLGFEDDASVHGEGAQYSDIV